MQDRFEKNHSIDGDAIKQAIESINGMSFTLPNYTYTFTSSNHAGLSIPQPMGFVGTGLGPDQFPYLAPGESY